MDRPVRHAGALAGLSGIELLSAISRGELPPPPVMRTLGIEPVEVGDGWMKFSLAPHEMHYNPLGTVHGGVIATLLDSAAGCAVHSVLPAGLGYTSIDLTAKYLRPGHGRHRPRHRHGDCAVTRIADRPGRGEADRRAGSTAGARHFKLHDLQPDG